MAINFDGLVVTDYVKGRADELVTKSALGAKTLDYIRIMPNVKHKDVIPYLEPNVVLQDGSACGWNPQDGDVFGERTIEVKPLKVEKEYCWKDFIATAYNHQLMVEAGREKLPFEEKFAEANLAAIKLKLDAHIWVDDSSLGTKGFIGLAQDLNRFTQGAGNKDIVTDVNSLVAQASIATVANGAYIFMSYTSFRDYVNLKNATCCANAKVLDAAADSIVYDGDSRITIVPVIGLEGQDWMFIASKNALVYGTDIENSENVFKMWRDEKDDKFLFRVLFNAGVAIARPDEMLGMTQL